MLDLEKLAHDYLEAERCRILERSDGYIIAQRHEFGGRDIRIVQTVKPGEVPSHNLLEKVVDIRSNYPDARATILVHSRDGISREFNAELSSEKVRVSVPVQFFDAPFRVETAPRTSSVIDDIRSQAAKEVRIPQPFELVGGAECGDDLFSTLYRDLANANGPMIRFVVGRAGVGKSYLFRALFQRLYSDFLKSKLSQRLSTRPIPLLPEHLKGSNATRIHHLIQSFLNDDVASPIQPSTFSWLLTNGFAMWLLDGLDELYTGDYTFFEDVFDLLGEKESQAQITILCRDSLLTSSESFAEFLDIYKELGIVKVFKLKGWERQQKRVFAWFRTKDRKPRPQEDDPTEVSTFLSALDKSQTLKELSSLPFYCELIFDRIRETGVPVIQDDVELLNSAIDDMVDREQKKGLLHESFFEENGLAVWMEEIAAEYVEGRGYVDSAQMREFGELVLREDLSNDKREDILRSLLQFPLFAPSEEGTGRISFNHELIAQALAARFYLKEIGRRRTQTTVFERLISVDFGDPVSLRFVASRVTPEMTKFVLVQLQNGRVSDAAFSAVLFLLLMIRPERDLFKRENLHFSAANLAGISFDNRDLSGHSFNECNLSRVSFKNCDLRHASFEGSLLNQTSYVDCKLEAARFGNISRIESISFGGPVLHDNSEIREKIAKETGMTVEVLAEPCPTALQVVQLFSKFVNPLGNARRDRLDERGLLAGRRVKGAASSAALLCELVQAEYLIGPDKKHRYLRGDGNFYREIVEAVKEGTLSKGLNHVIGRFCQRAGCLHQVR